MVVKIFFEYNDGMIEPYVNREAKKYWFDEQNFARLITYLFGDREFYIGEIFDFFDLKTINIKNRIGENLFDRDFDDDFHDILKIYRKYFRADNKESMIVYELISLNH